MTRTHMLALAALVLLALTSILLVDFQHRCSDDPGTLSQGTGRSIPPRQRLA